MAAFGKLASPLPVGAHHAGRVAAGADVDGPSVELKLNAPRSVEGRLVAELPAARPSYLDPNWLRWFDRTVHVTCLRCQTRYTLDDALVPPGGAQVQCTACGDVFVTHGTPMFDDTVAMNRSERQLFASLVNDLRALRTQPQPQPRFLGDVGDEPTVRRRAATTEGLRELVNVRQVPGESKRRWFTSNAMELIVWLGAQGQPFGFQLCFGRRGDDEQALTYWPERGLWAAVIDEKAFDPPGIKGTPTLAPNASVDLQKVREQFAALGAGLPADVRALVLSNLGG